jgi:hypothetical protein
VKTSGVYAQSFLATVFFRATCRDAAHGLAGAMNTTLTIVICRRVIAAATGPLFIYDLQ